MKVYFNKIKAALIFLVLPLSVLMAHNSVDEPIKLPQDVIEGKLDNGLHYLIKKNANPKHQAEFRLVMNVGCRMENTSQPGVAHFLEHMAFEDTKDFPNQGHVKYLESLGMKFGQEINAFTGYDKTIYMFTVPLYEKKENHKILENGMNILKNWLCGIQFNKKPMERERKIILEELRCTPMLDPFYSLKIGNNVYSRHIPLGTIDNIKAVTQEKLNDYYHTWYVPHNASVIIIGDMKVKEVKRILKKYFASIPDKDTPYNPRHLTYATGTQVMQLSDVKKDQNIDLMIPVPTIIKSDISNASMMERDRLLVSLVNIRFERVNIDCKFNHTWYISDKSHVSLTTKDGKSRNALAQMTAAIRELRIIAKDGFTAPELAEAKKRNVKNIRSSDIYKDSKAWCDEFVDYLVYGDKKFYDDDQIEEIKSSIEKIDNKQLQSRLENWLDLGIKSTLIAFNNKAKDSDEFMEDSLKRIWDLKPTITRPNLDSTKLHVYEPEDVIDTMHIAFLEKMMPENDDYVVSKKVYKEMGVTEIKLTNGAILVFRKTVDDASEVNIEAIFPGGFADIQKEDYYKYDGIIGNIEMGGILALDGDTYNSYLYDKSVSLSFAMQNHWHSIMALTSTKHFNEMLNIIEQKIYAPSVPRKDFEDIKKDALKSFGETSSFDNMILNDPYRQLQNKVSEIMGDALLNPTITKEDIEKQDIDTMVTFYKKIYAATEGATYIFTGNFDLEKFERLAIDHIGAFPKNHWLNGKSKPCQPLPTRETTYHFDNKKEGVTELYLYLSGHYNGGLLGTLKLKILRALFQNAVIDELRMKQSITYSPYAMLSFTGYPDSRFYFTLDASMKEKNVGRAKIALHKVVDNLQTKLVDKEELNSIIRSFLIHKDAALADDDPRTWKKSLSGVLHNGVTLQEYNDYTKIIQSITPEVIQKTAKDWLTFDNCIWIYQQRKK